jgi:hypothetical protein
MYLFCLNPVCAVPWKMLLFVSSGAIFQIASLVWAKGMQTWSNSWYNICSLEHLIGQGRLLYFYSHGESRYGIVPGEVTHWELCNENIARKQVTRFPEVWSLYTFSENIKNQEKFQVCMKNVNSHFSQYFLIFVHYPHS